MWQSGVYDFRSQSLDFVKCSTPEIVTLLEGMYPIDVHRHQYGDIISFGNGPSYLMYQLEGCEWTTIDSLHAAHNFYIRSHLSAIIKELNTEAIQYDCNKTSEYASYCLFNSNEILESFSYPDNNPSLDARLREADDAEEIERIFLECEDTVDNFFKSRNIFVFCGSWSAYSDGQGQIEFRDSPLTEEDFRYIYLVEFSNNDV